MDLRDKAREQVEKAKEFNRKPPVWAVVVTFIVIAVVIQIFLVLARS